MDVVHDMEMVEEVVPHRRHPLDKLTRDLVVLLHEKSMELEALDGYLDDAQAPGNREIRDLLLRIRQHEEVFVGQLEKRLASRLRRYAYDEMLQTESW